MFKIPIKEISWIILICLISKETLAITGEEISAKVSDWLTEKGVNGTPVFSKNRRFRDCKNQIEIKKVFKNYKTIKAKCLDDNGFEVLMRVNIVTKDKVKKKIISKVKLSLNKSRNSKKNKKFKNFKTIKLKKSLEKNDIIKVEDIETVIVNKRHQKSFFSNKKELIGRKLKQNLKMGQILHPRHLFESFDINNGDIISIVSNIGNASVTVSLKNSKVSPDLDIIIFSSDKNPNLFLWKNMSLIFLSTKLGLGALSKSPTFLLPKAGTSKLVLDIV